MTTPAPEPQIGVSDLVVFADGTAGIVQVVAFSDEENLFLYTVTGKTEPVTLAQIMGVYRVENFVTLAFLTGQGVASLGILSEEIGGLRENTAFLLAAEVQRFDSNLGEAEGSIREIVNVTIPEVENRLAALIAELAVGLANRDVQIVVQLTGIEQRLASLEAQGTGFSLQDLEQHILAEVRLGLNS